jgi:penicillin-binding protein 1B
LAATKGKKRKSSGKAGRSARPGPARGVLGVLLRLGLTSALAAGCAALFVGYLLYLQAEQDVMSRLAGPVWANSGKVWSGPIRLWRGLQLSPEELALDLQAAGYARVDHATERGDFQLTDSDLLLLVPASKGPTHKTADEDVHITFKDGRISAISPRSRIALAPAALAGLRGDDNEDRQPIRLKDLPPHVPHAVLAMEDARFYTHTVIDPVGVLRAIIHNLGEEGGLQGGSTLTQQLTKNLFLSQERTYERKAREALLALAIERNLSKDEILELYLNEIYLGEAMGASICGIEQAARVYFGKPAARLSLGEAATLGGIVSAPNRFSPLRHPDRARERRDLALDRLLAVGWAEGEAVREARAAPLVAHPPASRRQAPFLIDAAVEQVEQRQGEGSVAARGLHIFTTLHPGLQRRAEEAVREGGAELDLRYPKAAGAEIALVAVRVEDGAVVALVGGRDYGQSQFNRAVHAQRQVGSVTKPLTFLAAFEEDRALSPMSTVDDSPIERVANGKTWAPANYDGKYKGQVTLRQALAESRNIPAVLIAERVGMADLAKRNQALGLLEANAFPAAALGAYVASPLQVAGAFTVFPGGGTFAPPRVIEHVTTPDHKTIWDEPPITLPRASPRAAFLATRLLEAVVAEGTGAGAKKHGLTTAVAGKTGTTDEARDAWFVGFTPELAVAVWVGFDKGRALGLTGGEAALPTWARFVAASGTARGSFRAPEGVEELSWCARDHLPAVAGVDCGPTVREWVSAGAAPAVERRADGSSAAEGDPGPIAQAVEAMRRKLGGGAPTPPVAPRAPEAPRAPAPGKEGGRRGSERAGRDGKAKDKPGGGR